MNRNKIITSVLGGAIAFGLIGSAAAYAQSATPSPTTPSTETPSLTTPYGFRGRAGMDGDHVGMTGDHVGMTGDRDQALADALGITLDELQVAEEEARIAMIDQAVADGVITQAQADQMKLYSGFGFGHGPGFGGANYDKDEYLAEALGITVEKLNEAELQAFETELAAAVEAGYLTQEQADLMLARHAVEQYVDSDAVSAQLRSAYEAALDKAVAAGDITQAQADALLAEMDSAGAFTFRGFGGRGGPGGHGGHGGRGGHGEFGFGMMPGTMPDGTTTPNGTTTPQTGWSYRGA